MAGLRTPCCHEELSAPAFLAAVGGYVSMTSSFYGTCPRCGEPWEFQFRGGKLVFGFIYAAGSPHFEGWVDVEAKGLHWDPGAGSNGLRWGQARWPAGED